MGTHVHGIPDNALSEPLPTITMTSTGTALTARDTQIHDSTGSCDYASQG
jgi:hypothetical protein